MGILHMLFGGYNWQNFQELLSVKGASIIGMLAVLEGLLSVDNAVVLAVMVSVLPTALMQKRALKWGIFGAFGFRFIAIALGVLLVKLWWIKMFGGLYLLYLAIEHFFGNKIAGAFKVICCGVGVALVKVMWIKLILGAITAYLGYKFFVSLIQDKKDEEAHGAKEDTWYIKLLQSLGVSAATAVFIGTVIQVEIMDIAFSADSVLAAFGMSPNPWVLLIGGVMGIVMMRNIAQLFVKLLKKFPDLEHAAYLLILIIGGKMIADVRGYHMSHEVFFAITTAIFGVTIIRSVLKNKKKGAAA